MQLYKSVIKKMEKTVINKTMINLRNINIHICNKKYVYGLNTLNAEFQILTKSIYFLLKHFF